MKVFHLVFEGAKSFTILAENLRNACEKVIPLMEHNNLDMSDFVEASEHELDHVSNTIH